ncbi:MAG: metal-binding protein [Alphaproteobacteria bacterium]|nr:metal-binding protein [Alphaproteobacteria bacterium]
MTQPAKIYHHAYFTNQQIADLIQSQAITIGGNKNLKIYGTLKCKSGKRMKRKNRVFFKSEQDAIACGYRPCGNCMRQAYLNNNSAKTD